MSKRMLFVDRINRIIRMRVSTGEKLRLVGEVLDEAGFPPGPENHRDEVSPMGRSPQRDCSTVRLAAA